MNNGLKWKKFDTTQNSTNPIAVNVISSLAPSIIVNSCTNQVRLVIGGTGGARAITSIAYVSCNDI